MKVTNIIIEKVDKARFQRLEAHVTIELNNVLKLEGLRVFNDNSTQGLFVAYPTSNIDGKVTIYAFPTDKHLKVEIEEAILNKFRSM